MSRIDRPSTKPAAPKASAPRHQPTKRVAQDIARLKKAKNAQVTKAEDGRATSLERTTTRKDTTTTSRLDERQGHLLESTFEYSKSTSKPGLERETTYQNNTDMLGRRSSAARTETTRELENGRESKASSKTTDIWGTTQQLTETNKELSFENGSETSNRRLSRDSRGNRLTSSDVTRVEQQGKSVVTTNAKREVGSERNTASSTTWEDQVFRLNDTVDWKKTDSVGKSYLKETEYDASRIQAKADKVGNAVDKVLGWLGLEPKEWKSEVPADRMKEVAWHEGDNSYVGARYGVSGNQSLSFDGKGLDGTFHREATAGVYANASGAVQGRFGEASYDARAKAEATASVDARGRLDSNGLDATVNMKVGAYVDAEVTGMARTPGLYFGGTELYAAVEGKARASAEVSAEATGQVSITRRPPTAVVTGTVGASAVAKVEGEVRASAGPFTIVGNAYASAGAEAKATGIFGYQDGKLKLGGSAGAALGVGAGAGVTVEVDVKQIGDMAKNAADLNKDGKLDWKDAAQAVKKTAKFALPGLGLFL
ncbi:MAG: hypothetical protein IT380_29495 [Myxococcales bacterium]|nr:hypothetical protein [Myxococcales bacterium]